jgi:hypothetical protein
VTFYLSGGPVTYDGASYFVYPGWNGNFEDGNDIAIIRLSTSVSGVSGYSIFTDNNFMGGAIAQLAGYGLSGYGSTGTNESAYPFGTLRMGQNKLDTVWNIPGNPFAFDFDDGTRRRDTIGNLIRGLRDLGTGDYEVMTAPGDSGGPSFINGQIVGIHSFGATFGRPFDVDNNLNSSFGELGGETRVAFYADWIRSTMVPEPTTIILIGSGLILVVGLRKRSKKY